MLTKLFDFVAVHQTRAASVPRVAQGRFLYGLLGVAVLLLTCGFAQAQSAASVDAAEAQRWQRIESIAEQAAEVRDLEARFQQERHTALLRRPIVSSGRVRMYGQVTRWETEGEHPSILQLRPDELRIYYPRQKAMEIYKVSDQIGKLASSPLPRLADLKEQFVLESVAETEQEQDSPDQAEPGNPRITVLLTPRSEALAEHVQRVRVAVDRQTGLAHEIELFQAEGERTLLRFTSMRTNVGLEPDDVALEPPPGTKVTRPLEGRREGESS